MSLITRTPLKRKTRLRPVSDKRKAKRASQEGRDGLAYMAAVRALPCIICAEYGFKQTDATEAHHWIMGRGSARKTPDKQVIPLCKSHHKDGNDRSKVAIHQEPAKWRELYGTDRDYVERVQDIIAQEAEL